MPEFINHALDRYYERTDLDITKGQILRAVENGNITYAKRISASKSLVYAMVNNNQVVKLVLSKTNKKILTVLPWRSIFKQMLRFQDDHFNGLFEVTLYPDCYLETNASHALTKIYKIHPDNAREPIPFNHPFFAGLFKIAWDFFVQNNENHKFITQERKSGNEKIAAEMYYGGTTYCE
jgi:hypothetical protein